MKKNKWIFLILAVAVLPFISVLPAAAQEVDVSDISLQPGANPSELNITWHTGDEVAEDAICSVQVTKNPMKMKNFHWFFSHFPGFTRTFEGEWVDVGIDEYGDPDAYCKVTVDGLKNWEKYTYRVSDGTGDWSESYKYTPSNQKKYGFLFVADSQIGASGPKELSRSREIQPAVEEYYEEDLDEDGEPDNALPDIDDDAMLAYLKSIESDAGLAEEYLTSNCSGYDYDGDAESCDDEDIAALLSAYLSGELDLLGSGLTTAAVDEYLLSYATDYTVDYVYDELVYDEYSEELYLTDLEALGYVDPGLQTVLLDLIDERVDEHMAATEADTEGWVATVDLMTAMYPRASFIVSCGDQVELADKEWEYTGFFAPEQLTSIPVAPTYASHDRALNFEYHFSLPNESTEYGVDSNEVGDYYFTHGDTLIMVLNMDVTNNLFPRGDPPGPPPGGGGGPDEEITDTDGDGVADEDDLCPETDMTLVEEVTDYGCDVEGDYDGDGVTNENDWCPETDMTTVVAVTDWGCDVGGDYDGDGVLNASDFCNNTYAAHYDLIDEDDGCPVDINDVDGDGIPDVDDDGVTIDRCLNTYDDFTVDEDGCAECAYLETDDELQTWLAELEATCEDVEDEDTGEVTTVCELDDFKASLEEHQAFMAEAIEANPNAKWKIVVWHYSIYSAAMHSTDDQSEGIRYLFTPMLDDLDIDVVLMGHDHAYTRTYQMLENEPQPDQMVGGRGQVINPTGVLYLTASSSSGSKYYELNCNIADPFMTSNVYYEYAANFDEYIPTFTYFEVDDNSLKLSTYTYLMEEDDEGNWTGGFEEVDLIDEYEIEKKPPFWKKGKQGEGGGK